MTVNLASRLGRRPRLQYRTLQGLRCLAHFTAIMPVLGKLDATPLRQVIVIILRIIQIRPASAPDSLQQLFPG
ncbi:hypothetical protein KL950_002299 [Ogataea haglerorum]|nr:hypothetical protein KL915_002634 [Ogataea haglerorum]KAG7696642.1 hypothetical protein KL951_003098 [Ogataea haglerorum]KAG7708779.1 hypothetical protein KL950_002299 [Ogataea haglerorum]